jgi:hypothetical protein
MNPTAHRSFNPWPWLPLVALAATAVPCIAITVVAHRLHPAKVEELPYQASVNLDAEKRGREAFIAAGFRLAAEPAGPLRLRFRLDRPAGTAPAGAATMLLYRPDTATCDSRVPWPDSDRPLEVAVPRAGLWRARVELRQGGRAGDGPLAGLVDVEAAGEGAK